MRSKMVLSLAGGILNAFWPVSGECFAPYWEQGFWSRTASDLAYHQCNAKAKIGSWAHHGSILVIF